MRRQRHNSGDVVDRAVETGLDLYGHIWEVPYSVLQHSLRAALDLKDAAKKTVGLNPREHKGLLYLYRVNGRYLKTLNPAKEREWECFVSLAQEQPERYHLVRAADESVPRGTFPNPKRRRRNPEEEAARMYEKFHGRPSGEQVIIEKEFHEHEHLAALGDFVEVWIETPTQLLAHIRLPENNRPFLSTNEDGTQLYIEGGDQAVDLNAFKMGTKDWRKERMVLGRFAEPSEELKKVQLPTVEKGERYHPWNITYLTQKVFDNFEDIEYQHDLGEPDEGEPKTNRRESPYLEYEPLNEQLYVTGGQYRIKKPVFGTSPGIEN